MTGCDYVCRPGGIPARNFRGERLLLYIGIIDILQSYRLAKRLEHAMKSIVYDAVCNSLVCLFGVCDLWHISSISTEPIQRNGFGNSLAQYDDRNLTRISTDP